MKILAGGRWLEHTEVGRAKNTGSAVTAFARGDPLCPRAPGWAHSFLAPKAKPRETLSTLTSITEGVRRLKVH